MNIAMGAISFTSNSPCRYMARISGVRSATIPSAAGMVRKNTVRKDMEKSLRYSSFFPVAKCSDMVGKMDREMVDPKISTGSWLILWAFFMEDTVLSPRPEAKYWFTSRLI